MKQQRGENKNCKCEQKEKTTRFWRAFSSPYTEPCLVYSSLFFFAPIFRPNHTYSVYTFYKSEDRPVCRPNLKFMGSFLICQIPFYFHLVFCIAMVGLV